MKILRLLRALFGLINFRTWGPFLETYQTTRFDHALSVSWAQAGEDLALASVFDQISNGTYIDVGAHHPSRFSLTRILYQRGWSGVNVDANNDLIGRFEIDRTRDINLNYCVGLKSEYVINIFEEPALSTVSNTWKERFLGENQKIREIRRVQGIKLSELVRIYIPINEFTFLNIDIEGADLEALKSLELETLQKSMWPSWVMLETLPPITTALSTPAVEYLTNFGYTVHLVLPNSTLLHLT